MDHGSGIKNAICICIIPESVWSVEEQTFTSIGGTSAAIPESVIGWGAEHSRGLVVHALLFRNQWLPTKCTIS